jgi:transcriptional regulator with PAS, ATPase and Fis domain
MQGIIIVFNEIKRLRKLVNKMAGTQARFTFEDIVGVSPAFQESKRMAMTAALSKSTVLLLGETGTGKELFAQSIHNQSPRRDHPLLAINCGAIPRELLESELFGYVEGSFTGARRGGRPGKFELADGGTVFLDEIGDMSVDMQVKLLRVLQTGEVYRVGEHKPISVDVRIIAATNVQLKNEVDRGNFRQDLFYRLNVFPIIIPPLRERSEDIIHLARYFLGRCTNVLKKPGIKFAPETEQALVRYAWPGNVRELENIVERAANLADDETIKPNLLGLPEAIINGARINSISFKRLAEVEKKTIMDSIEATNFNLSQASNSLGISRATLYNKIKKYNLLIPRESV